MPAPPDRLHAALAGRYAIDRELGEGGMATELRSGPGQSNRGPVIALQRNGPFPYLFRSCARRADLLPRPGLARGPFPVA